MVVIRLSRGGAKHSPKYRITVADSRRSPTGRFLDIVGYYNPSPKGQEKGLEINIERIKDWMSKGAQPTRRVQSLMRKAQVE